MANKHRGQVEMKVGDKTLTLVFSTNAICDVEQALSMSVTTILRRLQNPETAPMYIVRALLWGGVKTHHPEIDLAGAGAIIDELGGAAPALYHLGKALEVAFPDAPNTENPQTGPAAGTGRPS